MTSAWRRAVRTIRDDLDADPYLGALLLGAALLAGFWFWLRAPNYLTPDEYGRLLRPMKAAGEFLADPGVSSFVGGATDGVPQGASFYLYAVTLVPAGLIVLLTGHLGEFASFASFTSRWDLWHAVPAWFWGVSILTARLVNVALAVGCVYVVYRLSAAAWDRRSGRYAGVTLALTLAFLGTAHEVDEDTAMLFALLVAVYLALRYVQTGATGYAILGAFVGGLAIAFKLTAGTVVFVLVAALLVRARREVPGDGWPETVGSALREWRLWVPMALVGVVTIYVGRPHVLFTGPEALIERVTNQGLRYAATSPAVSPPLGYVHATALLSATGAPLAVALAIGLGWHTRRIATGRTESPLPVILAPAVLTYLFVFGRWTYIRAHHLLPLLVIGAVLLGPLLARWRAPDAGRARRFAVVGLLVTTAIFAGVGTASFAADPRDRATDWVRTNVSPNASHLVYEDSVADVGVVHGRPVETYDFYEAEVVPGTTRNDSAYTEWIVRSVHREPEYIQVTGRGAHYADPLRREHVRYPQRAAFFERLVYGDHFGYEVAAEFGRSPVRRGYAYRLLLAGVDPRPEKREEYVLLLRRPDDAGRTSGA